ncbi:MAG: hypothetical protein ACK4F6_19400 [Hylemonella sp.]
MAAVLRPGAVDEDERLDVQHTQEVLDQLHDQNNTAEEAQELLRFLRSLPQPACSTVAASILNAQASMVTDAQVLPQR